MKGLVVLWLTGIALGLYTGSKIVLALLFLSILFFLIDDGTRQKMDNND